MRYAAAVFRLVNPTAFAMGFPLFIRSRIYSLPSTSGTPEGQLEQPQASGTREALMELREAPYPYSKMCNVCNVCNALTNKSKRYCTVCNARYTHCSLHSLLCRCAIRCFHYILSGSRL